MAKSLIIVKPSKAKHFCICAKHSFKENSIKHLCCFTHLPFFLLTSQAEPKHSPLHLLSTFLFKYSKFIALFCVCDSEVYHYLFISASVGSFTEQTIHWVYASPAPVWFSSSLHHSVCGHCVCVCLCIYVCICMSVCFFMHAHMCVHACMCVEVSYANICTIKLI